MARVTVAQHQQLDPIFKQTLVNELTPLPATLQTEVEVSRLPRTIDAIVTVEGEEARQTDCHQRTAGHAEELQLVTLCGQRREVS
jgi:hypothetical protein